MKRRVLLMRPTPARHLMPLLVAGWIGWAGCRSVPEPAVVDVSGPGWRVQQGQATWRPRREGPELTGDLLVGRHADGRFIVHFSKPALPLVMAQGNDQAWRLEFVAEHRVLGGRGAPRGRFVWLVLPLALEGRGMPSHWRFNSTADSGWRLENPRTGEALEGYFDPR